MSSDLQIAYKKAAAEHGRKAAISAVAKNFGLTVADVRGALGRAEQPDPVPKKKRRRR